MQNENHKILGVIFLFEFAVVLLIFLLFVGIFLVNSGLVLFNGRNSGDFVWMFLIYTGVLLAYIIYMTPFGIGGWKLYKNRPGAKFWGVIASVFSLPFVFPFGIVICIVGFVLLFSNSGKTASRNSYVPSPNLDRQMTG